MWKCDGCDLTKPPAFYFILSLAGLIYPVVKPVHMGSETKTTAWDMEHGRGEIKLRVGIH